MDGFETNTVLDGATLREIKYKLMIHQRVVILVVVLTSLCLLIISVERSYVTHTTVVAAIALVVFVIEYFFIANRNVKVILKRMRESARESGYRYTTSFTDEGMLIINHTLDSKMTIFYEAIKSVEESKNYFIIHTKAKQFALVNRETIDRAGKREALKTFLHSRCPKLRWKEK